MNETTARELLVRAAATLSAPEPDMSFAQERRTRNGRHVRLTVLATSVTVGLLVLGVALASQENMMASDGSPEISPPSGPRALTCPSDQRIAVRLDDSVVQVRYSSLSEAMSKLTGQQISDDLTEKIDDDEAIVFQARPDGTARKQFRLKRGADGSWVALDSLECERR